MREDQRVVIVGGGVAGLTCARVLSGYGVRSVVFEASERVGGRLGSDRIDGHTLERGFQIFLTGYPEAKRLLDYDSLNLCRFVPGAIVRYRNHFHRFVDPRRRPTELSKTAFSPLASLRDKLRVPIAGLKVANSTLPHVTTLERLKGLGFSDRIIDNFFRPFFGGIYLESELTSSSRMFDFLFKLFATSDSAIPAGGMQAIADHLAAGVEHSEIVTGCRVEKIEGRSVRLANGGRVEASAVVTATEADAAARLLPDVSMPRAGNWTGTTCVYYAADKSPVNEGILVLNADVSEGPLNNVAVLSDVSPDHAPPGKATIACTVLGSHVGIEPLVNKQLKKWYGRQVDQWRHLKTYNIPHALPDKSVDALQDVHRPAKVGDGIYLCGDHCDTASINGAMASGRRAAEAVVADLGRQG